MIIKNIYRTFLCRIVKYRWNKTGCLLQYCKSCFITAMVPFAVLPLDKQHFARVSVLPARADTNEMSLCDLLRCFPLQLDCHSDSAGTEAQTVFKLPFELASLCVYYIYFLLSARESHCHVLTCGCEQQKHGHVRSTLTFLNAPLMLLSSGMTFMLSVCWFSNSWRWSLNAFCLNDTKASRCVLVCCQQSSLTK